MRYGCVRNSHRLNVGEPVGIRQSRKDLLAKRSVMAKTIRYLDMFSGMGGFREGLTRADRLRAGAKPPRPFCPASDFGGRKRVAPMDGVPRVETAGTHLACRDVRGCGCGDTPPGLLPHDEGRTFAAILHALDRLGYGVEWQVLNSKDFHVPQSRKRVYLVGYLDVRCREKIFRLRAGAKPSRPFCPASDFGGRKRVASTGRLSRVETAGTHPACRDVRGWECGEKRRGGLPARVPGRLTPQECLRLQGRTDDRIDLVMPIQSDSQLYKQAGNGVTVTVVEAIGKRLAAMGAEWEGGIQ